MGRARGQTFCSALRISSAYALLLPCISARHSSRERASEMLAACYDEGAKGAEQAAFQTVHTLFHPAVHPTCHSQQLLQTAVAAAMVCNMADPTTSPSPYWPRPPPLPCPAYASRKCRLQAER